jgi:hypothetical protein
MEQPNGIGRNMSVMRRGRILTPKIGGAGGGGGNAMAAYALPSSAALNTILSKLFLEAYIRLCFSVREMMPCQVHYYCAIVK